ncbi:MAG: hypothetical protein NVS1B7_8080 [Candidatus Saccharimonadales bacterium]
MLQRLQNNRKMYTLLLALLVGVVPTLLLISSSSYAADLSQRKIQLSSSKPLAPVTHSYSFNLATGGMLGSMIFEYCSNSPLFNSPCTVPAGLEVRGTPNPPGQTGATGFVVVSGSTANKLVISRAPAMSVVGPVSYTFTNIINPSSAAQTVFVRISTYASIDTSGFATDRGSVAFSTSGAVGVFSFVPPTLTSCTGLTVGPRCTAVNGSLLNLGELSSSGPKTGTTQFSAATNDPYGYITYISGISMTSGNNVITPLSTPKASVAGTSQFGINLRANTNPAVGQNPTGVGTGIPSASYNTPNLFAFSSGDALISSSLPTDFNIFTISYVVNIANSQPPGQYNTTQTLITVVQF